MPVQNRDILITLGIQPDSPNTGYGYIKFEKNKSDIKKVKNFTEKPDLEDGKTVFKEWRISLECRDIYMVGKEYYCCI